MWCSNLVEPQAFIGFNIGGYIFVVHTQKPIDGSWMKVREEDFSKTIVVVKIVVLKQFKPLFMNYNGGF